MWAEQAVSMYNIMLGFACVCVDLDRLLTSGIFGKPGCYVRNSIECGLI